MPGSTPPTSQLDWLSSTTAMIVLSWSKATRDLLKSFSWGIGALRQLFASDDGAISSPPAPYHLSAGGNRIRTRGPMSGGEPARTNELSSHHNCGGRSELSPNLMRDERLQFLPQHRLDPGQSPLLFFLLRRDAGQSLLFLLDPPFQ